jgi:hypothetical protein
MAASRQGETAIAGRVITSTTSRACPSDPAARQSMGRYALAREQTARPAVGYCTNPTSTSRQLVPGPHRCQAHANPNAPATAAPAAILFSFTVNSSIGWLPRRTLAKAARRSRLFPMPISSHRLRSLATSIVVLRFLDSCVRPRTIDSRPRAARPITMPRRQHPDRYSLTTLRRRSSVAAATG